jgi:hypothetical protein
MDRKSIVRKCLAVGIILLFVGVAIAPSINFTVVKASNDNDLVEVTTRACGIQGFGNTTVKLTRQQYQNLEEYLVNFGERLNQTTTREEAVPLFKDAVVELNRYGLLPKGMSVEQAQTLVTGQYQNKNLMKLQDKLVYNHLIALNDNSNYFCLISGETANTCFMHVILNSILFPILNFSSNHREIKLFLNIAVAIAEFYFAKWFLSYFPFPFIEIGTGIYFSRDGGDITSVGLLGKKSWTGDFSGGFQKVPAIYGFGFTAVLGVIGFTGFHITIISVFPHAYAVKFLGSALAVKLNVYNP